MGKNKNKGDGCCRTCVYVHKNQYGVYCSDPGKKIRSTVGCQDLYEHDYPSTRYEMYCTNYRAKK